MQKLGNMVGWPKVLGDAFFERIPGIPLLSPLKRAKSTIFTHICTSTEWAVADRSILQDGALAGFQIGERRSRNQSHLYRELIVEPVSALLVGASLENRARWLP
jgi:hypothetical protein